MIQKSKGILIVLSGFSGSGKGTIMKELMKKYSEQYALSISATTRSPRPGETDGVEYFFKTKEQFEKMIADDELIEYAKYVDNYYGTPKAYVEEQLAAGKDVILEIEIQGALKVKEKFPDTLLMFVTPPSAEELKNRLVGRGTEEMSVIESRLSRAVEEAQGIEAYDYLIVNDKLDECVEEVHSIIHNEHFRVSRNLSAIYDMRHQLTAFSKYGKKLTLDIGNQISLKKINENESAARQKRGNIMIHPSYVELMKVVNNNVEFGEEPVVNSRYSLVIAAAKRARQIIAGDEPMADKITCPKPLSIAVEELYEGKVKIIPDTEDEE